MSNDDARFSSPDPGTTRPPAIALDRTPCALRVLHVITRLIVGGAQENTLHSVLGLRAIPGVQAWLASGPTVGPEGSLEPVAEAVPGLLTRIPSLVRPVHPARDVAAWLALHRLFRATRPDIVHTHSGKAGIVGRLAARTARIPVVIHTIHGPSFGPFQGRLANAVFSQAERLAARYTTHFVTVADAMTRQYLAAGIGRPEQFTRIFSGFELAPFLHARNDPALRARLGLSPDDLVVGKIARLFDHKGHDDLIQAAASILSRAPQVRFLLIGDGTLRPRLEAEIARRGLTGKFFLTGLVPPSEIPGWVGIMDMVVHLSRREGLPRALPQAMAAGLPVIAMDCDGASEVCLDDRTGYLVKPGDLDALTNRVQCLAADPNLRRRLGECGREWVRERFSVEAMIQALHALYIRLLARGAPEDQPRSQP